MPIAANFDLPAFQTGKFTIQHYMRVFNGVPSAGKSQELRLKRNQFNLYMLSYLRVALRYAFYAENPKKEADKVLIGKPSDLDFELHCLRVYKEVALYFEARYSSKSSLESDLELLSVKDGALKLRGNQRTAVVFRAE